MFDTLRRRSPLADEPYPLPDGGSVPMFPADDRSGAAQVSLRCRLTGHRRSREKARMDGDLRLHSECERCGRPLIKTWDKGWIEDRAKGA